MQDVSVIELFGRLALSLGVVLVVMVFAIRLLRRRMVPGASRNAPAVPVEVLGRHGLSRGSSVVVLRTAGRVMVLGVTETSVNLLAEAEPSFIEKEPEADRTMLPGGLAAPTPSWTNLIHALREKTVRRS